MDIDRLLGEMTLEEKVGQLFLLAFEAANIDAAELLFERYFVGGSYLSNDNLPDPATAAAMTARIQGFAARTRLALPVFLGADQEGAWQVMYPDSCPGPGNMALGASGDPEQARAMYRVIGEEVRAVGLHATFGPCADCNTNPANAIIGTRSFGERPELVAAMTAAAVEGALEGGAIPTLKHYPGHGDTTLDSHRGLPTVDRSRDELLAVDLLPFARGVAAGAPLVMTAHIRFPALDPDRPATLSPVILDEILRGELGFDGAVISDSMNMHSMRTVYDPVDAATQAINAGVDILMLAEEHYDHDAAYLGRDAELDLRPQRIRVDAVAVVIRRHWDCETAAPCLGGHGIVSSSTRAIAPGDLSVGCQRMYHRRARGASPEEPVSAAGSRDIDSP